MRLYTFISDNLDAILVDWVAFARELQPSTSRLDESGLLDHGRLILMEIASDMQKPQSAEERQDKSEGAASGVSNSPQVPSRAHALQRKAQGFDIEALVAEYRALRATVLRLWTNATGISRAQEIEDITRFNEAVDQAIAESLQAFLAELDKSRDLFLGVLGHDLRGPLSTIANIATLDIHKHPDNSNNAAVVLRSVAQMKALLDDLVEYAKFRLSPGFVIENRELHLGEFAHNLLGEVAVTRNDRPIELKLDGDLQGVWDAQRLHQALSNLIFNALKYGYAHEPIIVSVDGTSTTEVTIAVENSGKPIAQKALATLFDPLVRGGAEDTDPTPSGPIGANMGLGLYVVQEITKAHGGTVEVISNDSFTRFLMRLPRHPPTGSAQA